MARLKIELPEKLVATVSIPVRITDINYGNHLGHNSLVEIIHEARVQFLNQHGFTELNIADTAVILKDLLVEFINESFYNDLLEIKIFSGEITRVSFELFYEIAVNMKERKMIIALAKTAMVCYNYEIKKVRSVPTQLRSIL